MNPCQRMLWPVGWMILSLCGMAAAQTADHSPQLIVAGADEEIWAVSGEWEGETSHFIQHFVCRTEGIDRFITPPGAPPQLGRIHCVAVAGDRLHVIFSNGTHYSYAHSDNRLEIGLPDDALPSALAGIVVDGAPQLLALVDRKTAQAVEDRRHETMLYQLSSSGEGAYPTTRRAATATQATEEPTTAPAPVIVPEISNYHIVRYDGGRWRWVAAAPDGYAGEPDVWLTGHQRRMHLLWVSGEDAFRIEHARYHDDDWATEPALDLNGRVLDAAVRMVPTEEDTAPAVLFTALVPVADGAEAACRIRTWRPVATDAQPAGWSPDDVSLKIDDSELTVPATARIATGTLSLEQQKTPRSLVVLARQEDQRIEIGLWPTAGGEAVQPFTAVDFGMDGAARRKERGTREMIALGVVVALIMLVYWRRQSSLSQPVLLPPGFVLAGLGKRTLAALLDMAPAALIVFGLWHSDLMRFFEDTNAAVAAGLQDAYGAPPAGILWIWLYFRLIYTAYCLFFEFVQYSTPGKRMLGCEVLSESQVHPNAIQLLMRNFARLIELEYYLSIWPFVLFLFITPNRQRFGDLVARTIVVERRPEVSPPPVPKDKQK